MVAIHIYNNAFTYRKSVSIRWLGDKTGHHIRIATKILASYTVDWISHPCFTNNTGSAASFVTFRRKFRKQCQPMDHVEIIYPFIVNNVLAKVSAGTVMDKFISLIYKEVALWGLAHWGRNTVTAIFQTTFSNAFSRITMYGFRLNSLLTFNPGGTINNIPALV